MNTAIDPMKMTDEVRGCMVSYLWLGVGRLEVPPRWGLAEEVEYAEDEEGCHVRLLFGVGDDGLGCFFSLFGCEVSGVGGLVLVVGGLVDVIHGRYS